MRDVAVRHGDDGVGFMAHRRVLAHAHRVVSKGQRRTAQGDRRIGGSHGPILTQRRHEWTNLPFRRSMARVTGFRTIRGRMLFWVLVVTIPIYAAALSMSYHAAAQRLEEGAA